VAVPWPAAVAVAITRSATSKLNLVLCMHLAYGEAVVAAMANGATLSEAVGVRQRVRRRRELHMAAGAR
jgi:hypothetical protein